MYIQLGRPTHLDTCVCVCVCVFLIKHAPLPWVILHAVGIQLGLFQWIQWPSSPDVGSHCIPFTVLQRYSLNCVCIVTFTAQRNLWIL